LPGPPRRGDDVKMGNYDHDIEEARRRLQDQRQRMLHLLGSIKGGLRLAEQEALQELSSYDQHDADYATTTYEREKDLGLKSDLHRDLIEVDDALQRLEEGAYGICQMCGRPIDPQRLEAVPQARYCRPCQERVEERGGPKRVR